MWQHFKAIVTELIVSHIPLKGDKFRKKKGHWLHPTTIRMIKKRDSAWKKYIHFKSNTNYNSYKTIRNKVNSMIRADGDAFRKSLFKGFKTKPKKFYSYIRNLQTVKDAATVLQKPDSTLTTTDDETAETLKNQYQKIFVTEPPFDPSNTTVGITDGPSIENVSFDSSKVLHKLQRMKTDGSPGPDGLRPMVLVNCAASVAEPVLFL